MRKPIIESDAAGEIMLLESDWYQCDVANYDCYAHLNVYESAFMNRTAVYALASIETAGGTFAQRGLFVFHSADGLHRYMISRLLQFSGDDQPYYLTVVQ